MRVHAAAPPFPQKVTLRLRCPPAGALTPLRLAASLLQCAMRRFFHGNFPALFHFTARGCPRPAGRGRAPVRQTAAPAVFCRRFYSLSVQRTGPARRPRSICGNFATEIPYRGRFHIFLLDSSFACDIIQPLVVFAAWGGIGWTGSSCIRI